MSASRSRYSDRFDTAMYAEDEPVGVFVNADDADAVWVPERLFWRLVYVGRAYSLHLLPLLGDGSVVLNGMQIANLLDELAFVAELVPDDLLLTDVVTRLDRYLRRVLAANAEPVVTVDGV